MIVFKGKCGRCGTSYDAKDANEDINPDDVLAAVGSFKDAIDAAIKDIKTSLKNVKPDLRDAIRSYNKDLTGKLDEISSSLDSVGSTFKSITDDLYFDAIRVRDERQSKYNEDAEKALADCQAKHAAEDAAAAAAAAASKAAVTIN